MQFNKPKILVEDLNLYYGQKQVLKSISLAIPENQVTAIIGPSGCGKSTFIRALNRMNDLIPEARVEGKILIDNENIYDRDIDLVALRKKVGMVFQKPNPFPKSIFDNVAYGLTIGHHRGKASLETVVEKVCGKLLCGKRSKDRLEQNALNAVRRPAAEVMHCPDSGRRARDYSF